MDLGFTEAKCAAIEVLLAVKGRLPKDLLALVFLRWEEKLIGTTYQRTR